MTADDVRARFDFTISDASEGNPRILTWDGDNGCRPATDEEIALWDAHADLSGEVRELVEADRAYDEAQKAYGDSLMKDAGVTQRAWNRLGKAFERRATALAKFTHQRATNYVSGSVDVHGQFHPTHQEKP